MAASVKHNSNADDSFSATGKTNWEAEHVVNITPADIGAGDVVWGGGTSTLMNFAAFDDDTGKVLSDSGFNSSSFIPALKSATLTVSDANVFTGGAIIDLTDPLQLAKVYSYPTDGTNNWQLDNSGATADTTNYILIDISGLTVDGDYRIEQLNNGFTVFVVNLVSSSLMRGAVALSPMVTVADGAAAYGRGWHLPCDESRFGRFYKKNTQCTPYKDGWGSTSSVFYAFDGMTEVSGLLTGRVLTKTEYNTVIPQSARSQFPAIAHITVSGAYNLTEADDIVLADAYITPSVYLPPPTKRYRFTIKRIDNYLIVPVEIKDNDTGALIDGKTSITLTAQYESVTIVCNGSDAWFII